jgi:hypothetical protein
VDGATPGDEPAGQCVAGAARLRQLQLQRGRARGQCVCTLLSGGGARARGGLVLGEPALATVGAQRCARGVDGVGGVLVVRGRQRRAQC